MIETPLKPHECAALLMGASTVIVTYKGLLINRVQFSNPQPQG